MQNKELFEILRKLGLSERECTTYLEVVSYYTEISTHHSSYHNEPSFDHGSINRLQQAGMLYISKNYSGKQIIKIADPRISSRAIYSEFLWSLFPSEKMLCNLSDDTKARVVSFRKSCQDFEQHFGELYNPLTSSEGVLMVVDEAISGELAMCLGAAKEKICGITVPNWTPDTSLVWETIKDRILNGVSYERLADELTLLSFGYLINKRDVEEIGVKLKILHRRQFQEKYFVIDNKLAFVFWPSAPYNNFPLEASVTTMPMFVSQCRHNFESLWEKAIPVEYLLPFIGNLKNVFVEKCEKALGKTVHKTAELLFDYGKFCFASDGHPEYGIDQYDIEELRKHSMVILCPGENKAMIPNMVSDIRDLVDKFLGKQR